MIDTIIIVIVIGLLWFALKKTVNHFKGEKLVAILKVSRLVKKISTVFMLKIIKI
ncbi:MAG: hypothetical protein KHX14_08385 [[Clostridium] spiroforme]|uniref:Uncharacterized protein n=1 Tax=Thomasclavelia spiroformis TaxID=29348 RepID=A0A943ELC5_9FIRM|nr:hypothetical protein [Thomasclavelia spiroformis]MBS5588807.1 hypothetical protein [Thomasclavelia spiroformis]